VVVNLTQFLRPDGQQKPVTCEVSDSLKANYEAIRENGMRLTCEELSSGMVSLALEHRDGDFLIEVCENAPHLPKLTLEKLIGNFNQAEFDKWLAGVKAGAA
jgi:hypothetical protein